MTRADELNAEIRNQAVRLYPKCAGLVLPLKDVQSVRLDSKLLKTLHPDVYAECSSETTYKRFSVV